MPFGLRRFVPCDIGANHCRLRHIGWERCGHGLPSRPRESSSEDFLNRLLVLFGYSDGSAAALLAGVLPLRYCSARFSCKLPTWRLPDRGHVVSWLLRVLMVLGSLVMMGFVVFICVALLVMLVFLVRAGFRRALKEYSTQQKKTPAHLARLGDVESVPSRSRVWKRLKVSEARWCSICDSHVLHECHHSNDGSSLDDRIGVGLVFWVALAHVPRLCMKGVVISFDFSCMRM